MINLRNALMTGGSEPAPAYWGLCFTAEEAGSTVSLTKSGSPPAVTLETSRDGLVWTPYIIGDTITLANVGDKVFLAAGDSGNIHALSITSYYRFILSGRIAASGNIMSLLNRNEALTSITNYGFYSLFSGCTSLVSAPELPATTLASSCYRKMFSGCTSLVSAPELLPATIGGSYCYREMFSGCTLLVSAPELFLPTTTYTGCCRLMLSGCTSLNNIKVHFTEWDESGTNNWMDGVAATGTFKCPAALGTNATITRGVSNCPTGWTVVNI